MDTSNPILTPKDMAPTPSAHDPLEEINPGGSGPSTWSRFLEFLGLGGRPAQKGAESYRKGDFDRALQKFEEARLDHPESPELAHNIGNARYRNQKFDEAIEAYQEALRNADAELAESANYNAGNAYFRKGEFAVQSGDQSGIQHYRSAMAHYKKALELNPDNPDAKRNIEVVQARIKELLERQEQQPQGGTGESPPPPVPSERAKEVLARALQAAKQRRYDEAARLLEGIIAEDSTAVSFRSHLQRLDDVRDILEGREPSPPAGGDPRAQQEGLGVI